MVLSLPTPSSMVTPKTANKRTLFMAVNGLRTTDSKILGRTSSCASKKVADNEVLHNLNAPLLSA